MKNYYLIKKAIHQNIFTFGAAFLFMQFVPLKEGFPANIQFILLSIAIILISGLLGSRQSGITLFMVLGVLAGTTFSLEFNISSFDVIIPDATYYFINFLILCIFDLSAIGLLLLLNGKPKLKKDSRKKIKLLYPERLDNLKTCKDYLDNNSILGISSPYGNGKTFLIEALKEEMSNCTFIDIGVLSTTLENVETIILKEIGKELENHGVYSSSLNKLKSFLSQDVPYHIGEYIFGNESYVQQFKILVEDIHQAKVIIILNFKDLDRITNTNHLNKIFAICDTLVEYDQTYKEQKIKVIYQYNSDLMDERLNEMCTDSDKNRYRERFIPFTVELQALSPSHMFEKVRDSNIEKYPLIKDASFTFLNKRTTSNFFGINLSAVLINYRIRGLNQILDRIEFSLRYLSKENCTKDPIFQTICVYHVAEYFMKDLTDHLEPAKGLEYLTIFNDGTKNQDFDHVHSAFTKPATAKSAKEIYFKSKDSNLNEKNQKALYFLELLKCNNSYLMQKSERSMEKTSSILHDDEISIRVLNRLIQSKNIDDSVVSDELPNSL